MAGGDPMEEGRRDSGDRPQSGSRREPGRLLKPLWLAAGWLSLAAGFVGIFLPLLPTVPFVLLAAFCFSRGSARCERWLLRHPRFGPWVEDWRAHRAVPLRAKQLATAMMAVGSVVAGFQLPPAWCWVPAACCAAVAAWLWRLPTKGATAPADAAKPP
jgi:uncharacterized membrane protein YbaN (DUF454 family)